MINQTTNLIQWKNLTVGQKAEFDWSYQYEYQNYGNEDTSWSKCSKNHSNAKATITGERIYRLEIEPEKWYYCEWPEDGEEVLVGDVLENLAIENASIIRPCTPSEIPKPEPTLEEKIRAKYLDYEVVMLEWTDNAEPDANFLQISTGDEEFEPHVVAQSMKGFYKYVYLNCGGLTLFGEPTDGIDDKTIHPVAVLLEGAK